MAHISRDTEQSLPGGIRRPDLRECATFLLKNAHHIDECLHVVDQCWFAEQTCLHRERRLVSGFSPLPLYRVEERRLLSADIRARAAANLDIESNPRSSDVFAQVAVGPSLGDRILDTSARDGIFGADIQVSVLTSGRDRGDDHRFDNRERIAFHEDTILERPWLRFVGIAH